MGCAKRSFTDQTKLRLAQTSDAPNPGDVNRLLSLQGRKDAPQPPRQHGLSRSGGPDHEQVMASRGHDLQHTFGLAVTRNIGKVEQRPGRLHVCHRSSHDPATPALKHSISSLHVAKQQNRLGQGTDPGQRQIGDLGRLEQTCRGNNEEADLKLGRRFRDGQHPPSRLDEPVQRDLAYRGSPSDGIHRDVSAGCQDGQRHR